MGRIVMFCAILGVVCSAGTEDPKILHRTTRIIHGQPTDIANFPHHVRIDAKNQYVCGGSVISDKGILTAAHCIIDPNITVRLNAGASRGEDGIVAEVDRIVLHPGYDAASLTHDLALILLKENIRFEGGEGKIEISRENGDFPRQATMVGWGCTACIWFVPMWLCQLFPPTKELRFGTVVLEKAEGSMFVSNSRVKGCAGDSGGPVIDTNGKLIGVISHLNVCFLRNRPNYFMSVPDHSEWISGIIGE